MKTKTISILTGLVLALALSANIVFAGDFTADAYCPYSADTQLTNHIDEDVSLMPIQPRWPLWD